MFNNKINPKNTTCLINVLTVYLKMATEKETECFSLPIATDVCCDITLSQKTGAGQVNCPGVVTASPVSPGCTVVVLSSPLSHLSQPCFILLTCTSSLSLPVLSNLPPVGVSCSSHEHFVSLIRRGDRSRLDVEDLKQLIKLLPEKHEVRGHSDRKPPVLYLSLP